MDRSFPRDTKSCEMQSYVCIQYKYTWYSNWVLTKNTSTRVSKGIRKEVRSKIIDFEEPEIL